ncbi:hypothetical protein LTR08_005709 [Meristemomyces frigidus]|nr:hypothetical protein LTR08_005709 [Meristemomyces frigidus]
MRLGYYVGASTAAAAACLLKALHQRPNFYSAAVYLSQSSACLLILTNLLLVAACTFLYGLQRLLYGPLRPIELEQLSEKAWYAVLDTLLAMPSFREDLGGWLLAMFVLLLAGKVWGWIGEGRVDVLEQQPPANPRLFHARLATSLVGSVVFDLCMLDYCVEIVMADPRPGMMVIFTFEFAVLSIFSLFTLSRYILSLVQTRIETQQMHEAVEARKAEIRAERATARLNAAAADGIPLPLIEEEEALDIDENDLSTPGWEDKRRYLFALEVFTDFVKLVLYIIFFTVSITFNGLPMHIMRDVYLTFASFSKRVADYVAYRKATRDMNTRYPDATTEEIRGDACIVCRESMVAWEQAAVPAQGAGAGAGVGQTPLPPSARRDEGLRAKKLPCNHILHLRCLKAWLERQQVCPTCRRPVISPTEPAAGPPGQARPGQPGANVAAPGQPGQQQPRAPRPNRARIFNLGPVRIGFLNGPGDQMANIVNQMRGAPPAAQAIAGAAGGVPAGPNHLGLQQPYITAAGAGGARVAVPMQIQLMQLEQRLMHDAHTLALEQRQLVTLRAMEAELARLRAGVVATQVAVGSVTTTAAATAAAAAQRGQQQLSTLAGPEVLHSAGAQQQFHNGHELLPQGLVLPEGWTAMPLQRTDVVGAGASGAGQAQGGVTFRRADGSVFTRHAAVPAPSGQPAAPAVQTTTNGAAAGPTAVGRGDGVGGPRDENGSPLFVPTPAGDVTHAPVRSDGSATASAAGLEGSAQSAQSAARTPPASTPPTDHSSSSQTGQAAASTLTPQASQAPAEGTAGPPWTSDGDWSFVAQHDNEAGHAQQPDEGVSAIDGAGNGTARSIPPPQPTPTQPSGKGKGRAVEVEEASDGDEV